MGGIAVQQIGYDAISQHFVSTEHHNAIIAAFYALLDFYT